MNKCDLTDEDLEQSVEKDLGYLFIVQSLHLKNPYSVQAPSPPIRVWEPSYVLYLCSLLSNVSKGEKHPIFHLLLCFSLLCVFFMLSQNTSLLTTDV